MVVIWSAAPELYVVVARKMQGPNSPEDDYSPWTLVNPRSRRVMKRRALLVRYVLLEGLGLMKIKITIRTYT